MRLVKPRGSTKIEQPKALYANRWVSSLSKCGVVKVSISILNTNNTEYTLDYSVVSRDNNLYVVGDISSQTH